MPDSYVTKVTFQDAHDASPAYLVLTVQVNKYLVNKPVEISGFATQNSGGFAIFDDIQSVQENPDQPVQENPDETVTIEVKATPSVNFNTGEDVTVSLRVATVWVTVLGEGQDGPGYVEPEGTAAQGGETWGIVKEVGYPRS